MAKDCPFFQKECREKQCQLWVPTNDKNFTCAFAAIPQILSRDLAGLMHWLSHLPRS